MSDGWLDCAAGASGDMLLGALVDAGASVDAIQAAIAAVTVEQIRLSVSTVERHGLGATKVDVIAPKTTVTRTWTHIRGQLERADLAEPVRKIALNAFERLANAEAAVHRTTPDHVHFHEVGGLDAIADIVGTAAGLHDLGIDHLAASRVTLGSGMTRGEHGMIPIPGPATLMLLRDAEAPVWSGPAPYEMCTPTGAALLAATVSAWGPMPAMTVRTVGTGAGTRQLDELPNLIRLVLGDSASTTSDEVTGELVLQANVDDLDPRLWPGVLDALLAAGASDAWLAPIVMKKGRPAHTVHVLCPPSAAEALRTVLFSHTTTIGLREHAVDKVALVREQQAIEVRGHRVGVKIARRDGVVANVSVEFEDVRSAAEALGVPVRDIMAAATTAAQETYGSS
ncbi:MAG TPA: nickel pincer cofactor biosynthesis protein LarC [Mycobacteriales bacterium]|nr:nickel pincer cofactor biosynthesis protein LarC [Mycobacteriales bacterium]